MPGQGNGQKYNCVHSRQYKYTDINTKQNCYVHNGKNFRNKCKYSAYNYK